MNANFDPPSFISHRSSAALDRGLAEEPIPEGFADSAVSIRDIEFYVDVLHVGSYGRL